MLERVKSIRDALARTRQATFGRVATLFGATEITPELWDELEATLIQADVGVETTGNLIDTLQARVKREGIIRTDVLRDVLKAEMRRLLAPAEPLELLSTPDLRVILIVGTNGSGKTTSIAKLAGWLKGQGRSVLLAAADTFRAAAGEQLEVWAARAGVPVIGGQPGSDPGAIVYDALQAAQSRGVNVALVDTAGRMHTKENLKQGVETVRNVPRKAVPGAPHGTRWGCGGTAGREARTHAWQF